MILKDVDKRYLDRGMETISKNLDREVKKGNLPKRKSPACLGAFRLQPMRQHYREPILVWKPCRSDWT